MGQGCCSGCGGSVKSTTKNDAQMNLFAANLVTGLQVSRFRVAQMDCPAEEQLIRIALQEVSEVHHLDFNLAERQLLVYHIETAAPLLAKLERLNLGATLLSSEAASIELATLNQQEAAKSADQARLLRTLLLINAVMFVIEITAGYWAQSVGLIADGLDMLADAAVYGVALYAVGRSATLQLRAAHLSGWLQALLGIGLLFEVLHRFLAGSDPEPPIMIAISTLALTANVSVLWLLAKSRHEGAHMRASWIFSANDVLANLGVIVAAFLVSWSGTPYPDLIIGLLIVLLVLNGARTILKLGH